MAESAQQFFSELPAKINAEKVKGMTATYQWDITGDSGGKWYAVFNDGNLAVEQGQAENPDITITVAESDWVDIVNGKLNGQMAFLTGKLKIQGDMSLAMKLQNITGA